MKKHFTMESRIGRGAQHIVGKLRDGTLIKYPHRTGRSWDRSTPETVQRDLAIHRQWDTPIPQTDVVFHPSIDNGQDIVTPPYAILAEEIRGRVLHETDFKNPDIKDQLRTLAAKSLEIRRRTNSGIDFMGFESIGHLLQYRLGIISAEDLGTCNILVDTRERIKLIDTSLLTPARAPFGVAWAIDAMIDIEHGLMARVLDDQHLIRQSTTENHSGLMTSVSEQVYRLSRAKSPSDSRAGNPFPKPI